MPRRSSSSAGAVYLDRHARIDALRAAGRRAAGRLPGIRRILLFGSLASGIPTPRSDADLLVILESSPIARPRERMPEVLRALAPLPCPVDLVVLTEEEVERARVAGDPLVGVALARGIDLL
jgi:predicted nucleotidyltransferase